jgi:nicotinamidase-related amidase
MPDSGTALLIVDVQEASLDGCSDVPQVIDRINELLRRAGEASVPVIFIQHDGTEDGLARGTPGWELAAALERPDGAHLVEKSYRDAFADTELEPLLYRLGVKRLVVTGVHSDFCVQMTALSAVIRGFDLAFVSDAHTTRDSAALAGPDISALVNSRMAMLRHPGRTIEVVPAARVSLATAPQEAPSAT